MNMGRRKAPLSFMDCMNSLNAEYITHSGSDLLVANAARVSFDKESWWEQTAEELERLEAEDSALRPTLRKADEKLLSYLAEHKHWTPFAHPQITLRMTAPIPIRTQCFKHKVGFTENEISRRYVDSPPTFHTPEVWRQRAENKKQGSADTAVTRMHMHDAVERWEMDIAEAYDHLLQHAETVYFELLHAGVCPEQARFVLPQSMVTQWYWTGSLAAFARFVNLRQDAHAQHEVRELADKVSALLAPLFPVSWRCLTKSTP